MSVTAQPIEQFTNETALINLFITGKGSFSNRELEMYEVISHLVNSDKIRLTMLLRRIVLDDLSALTELKSLTRTAAKSLTACRAKCSL